MMSNEIDHPANGFAEFEFDLPGALLEQLVKVFNSLEPAILNFSDVARVPDEQGVYLLFLDSRLVYVGKTDADAGLRRRLSRHAKKILFREGLVPERVSFKAIRIFVFTAMDLESELIRFFGGVSQIPWNGSGFGSNDPGRQRDTTKVKADNFDAQFPIDIERSIDFSVQMGEAASMVLNRLKEVLPFTFRFENAGARSRHCHEDLESVSLKEMKGPVSIRSAVASIVAQLPEGWQATALKGYIILYKEAGRAYPDAHVIACT